MSGVIGAAVAVALISFLAGRAAKSELEGELRHGAFPAAFGALTALAALGMTYVMFFVNHRGQYVSIGLIWCFCAATAGYFFAEAYRTRGNYDVNGIRFETPWTGVKQKQWDDLQAVHFSPSMGWYVLSFSDGTTMRVSRLLLGHARLLEQLAALGFEPDGTRRSL
jgi:hypothetical protein